MTAIVFGDVRDEIEDGIEEYVHNLIVFCFEQLIIFKYAFNSSGPQDINSHDEVVEDQDLTNLETLFGIRVHSIRLFPNVSNRGS